MFVPAEDVKRVFKFLHAHKWTVPVARIVHLVQVAEAFQHDLEVAAVLHCEPEAAFVSPTTFAWMERHADLEWRVHQRVRRGGVFA